MIQPDNIVYVHSESVPPSQDVVDYVASKVEPLPGRVVVVKDAFLESKNGILMPDGKYRGSQDSDTGTVASSGWHELKKGDRVIFKPMHGIRCDKANFPWVPDGVEVRIYGVACDVEDSIVGVIE